MSTKKIFLKIIRVFALFIVIPCTFVFFLLWFLVICFCNFVIDIFEIFLEIPHELIKVLCTVGLIAIFALIIFFGIFILKIIFAPFYSFYCSIRIFLAFLNDKREIDTDEFPFSKFILYIK